MIKDYKYILKLFDGNNDIKKITETFLETYVKEEKKIGSNP